MIHATPTVSDRMPRTSFGRTSLRVGRLGFGGAPIGYLHAAQRDVDRLVAALLDAGVNLFDTAAGYRGSEQALGQALRNRRGEVVLVSKVGPAAEDLPGEAWTPELIVAAAERSLRRLRTDTIDIMLLHTCDLPTLRRGECVWALVRLQQQGKVRHIGYSGDNDAAAYAVQLGPFEVLETSVNIADQANIDAVLPLAVRYNVGVIAKRPLANAAWRQPYEQRGIYQDYVKPYADRLAKMNVQPNRLGYDDHVEVTWPDIALRFTLSIPGVHTAIVGTTNPDNAAMNLNAARRGPLPDEVVRRLRRAFADAEAGAGEAWVGLT